MEFQQGHFTTAGYIRKRPLHWCIISIALSFLFLLGLEAFAYLILGSWHLSTPRLNNLLIFCDAIYRRELAFGILLIVLGVLGILVAIVGLVATILLRLALLRSFAFCLWLLMILGIIIGIIGIVFASQVDGFLQDDQLTKPNLVEKYYYDEKFLLAMNGALTLFMSLTLIVGLIIVHCLSAAVHYHSYGHTYARTK